MITLTDKDHNILDRFLYVVNEMAGRYSQANFRMTIGINERQRVFGEILERIHASYINTAEFIGINQVGIIAEYVFDSARKHPDFWTPAIQQLTDAIEKEIGGDLLLKTKAYIEGIKVTSSDKNAQDIDVDLLINSDQWTKLSALTASLQSYWLREPEEDITDLYIKSRSIYEKGLGREILIAEACKGLLPSLDELHAAKARVIGDFLLSLPAAPVTPPPPIPPGP